MAKLYGIGNLESSVGMDEIRCKIQFTEIYISLATTAPLDNLFEWHFTVRGPLESDFDGGIYHGRILFPPEYPMKPPNVVILTVEFS
ncbi:hypothetical protein TELCIR_12728 [Teladorsagia circumcincta]|uniref:UBC core domain-containing protein n=1 Tax=Teladorsagia circumcincta TaxID=45464 RepID=A0A2G9U5P9_TELCI|nr:hypothetical protein TELCIR_12728 [Teladorsagia circumcincta]